VPVPQVEGVSDLEDRRLGRDAQQRADLQGEELTDQRGSIMAGLHQSLDALTDRGLVDLPQVGSAGERYQCGDFGGDDLAVRVVQRVECFLAGRRFDQGPGVTDGVLHIESLFE